MPSRLHDMVVMFFRQLMDNALQGRWGKHIFYHLIHLIGKTAQILPIVFFLRFTVRLSDLVGSL